MPILFASSLMCMVYAAVYAVVLADSATVVVVALVISGLNALGAIVTGWAAVKEERDSRTRRSRNHRGNA